MAKKPTKSDVLMAVAAMVNELHPGEFAFDARRRRVVFAATGAPLLPANVRALECEIEQRWHVAPPKGMVAKAVGMLAMLTAAKAAAG